MTFHFIHPLLFKNRGKKSDMCLNIRLPPVRSVLSGGTERRKIRLTITKIYIHKKSL